MHPKQFVELSPDELCRAVEAIYKCTAHFEYWHHVQEPYGAVWWMGGVGVFRLVGHPVATRCYAWSFVGHGAERRDVYAVLHLPPVESASDAVRDSLARSGLPAECPP